MKAVMYHYIREPESALPFFNFLHATDFAQQLNFFQQIGRIASPTDLFDALDGKSPLPQGFLLTFDDGLKDHWRYVVPELLQRNVQAFFFVSTGWYQQGKVMDVHKVHWLMGKLGATELWQLLQKMVKPDMILEGLKKQFAGFLYPNQQNDLATRSVKELLNFYMDEKSRSEILNALLAHCGNSEQALGQELYLTIEELKKMETAGMVIGSHTQNHPVLSKLSVQEQAAEIAVAKAFFAENGFTSPLSFCYPYGYSGTFTHETENLLANAGNKCSFMVNARSITTEDLQSPQTLPRFDCNMFPNGALFSH